jgi:hypothetical protein
MISFSLFTIVSIFILIQFLFLVCMLTSITINKPPYTFNAYILL